MRRSTSTAAPSTSVATFTVANLGNYTRSGGTINLTGTLSNPNLLLTNATGSWNLDTGSTIVGGTITASGTAIFNVTGAPILNAVTVAGQLDSDGPGNNLQIENGLTLSSATLNIGYTGAMTFVDPTSNAQTVGGTGTIDVISSNGGYGGQLSQSGNGSNTQTVTFGPNVTIASTDGNDNNIGDSGASENWIIQGNLDVNDTNQTPGNHTILYLYGKNCTNQGTWEVDSAATLNVASTNWTNSGTVTLGSPTASGGTLNFATGGTNNLTNFTPATNTLTGGTWNVYDSGVLRGFTAGITTDAASILLDSSSSNIYTGTGSSTTSALSGLATIASADAAFTDRLAGPRYGFRSVLWQPLDRPGRERRGNRSRNNDHRIRHGYGRRGTYTVSALKASAAVDDGSGAFTIQDGRNFTTPSSSVFTNNGTLDIGVGSTLSAPDGDTPGLDRQPHLPDRRTRKRRSSATWLSPAQPRWPARSTPSSTATPPVMASSFPTPSPTRRRAATSATPASTWAAAYRCSPTSRAPLST